jgi:hypothetical protein
VTGVLLYSNGTFHQYLEGPPDALDRVFEAICRDPLHHQIFEILREPIEAREFPTWEMGYRGERDIEGLAADVDLTEMLSDESPRLSNGRLLLHAFWDTGLGERSKAAVARTRERRNGYEYSPQDSIGG